MPSYIQRLHKAVTEKKTPALVGLDPRFSQLPQSVIDSAKKRCSGNQNEVKATAYEEFCCRIIDVVSPLVPAVKPQVAFFEQCGSSGMTALARVMIHARQQGLIVIADAKRGDIGSTADAYADAWLSGEDPETAPFASDALTVNPYLGKDTLEPFTRVAKERNAGIYILVRTSNPGAGTFQDQQSESGLLYEHVAKLVEELAVESSEGDAYGSIGAVIGATYPEELTSLRKSMPHTPFLIPGYGSQGGGVSDVLPGFQSNGLGALINSSRGINFAYEKKPYKDEYSPEEWEKAVEAATKQMIVDLSTVFD